MRRLLVFTSALALGLLASHCGSDEGGATATGNGGASPGTGGATGGTLASGGTASGGSSASGGQGTGAFAEVEGMLQKSCATCHNGKGVSVDRVNLSNSDGSAALYGRLTTAIPDTIAKCRGVILVDRVTPSMSLLTQIIETNVSIAGCMVARMPNQCTDNGLPRACLSAAEIAIIQSWVRDGAPGP